MEELDDTFVHKRQRGKKKRKTNALNAVVPTVSILNVKIHFHDCDTEKSPSGEVENQW